MEDLQKQIITWRRHLHMYPELSYEEVKTAQYVEQQLKQMAHFHITRLTPTSVLAVLKGKRPGKTVAFRADMDALPIQEDTDLPFQSKHDGVMHSCGHDAHTAMLLGAAKVLSERGQAFAGELRFVFQHGEEVAPGGAVDLVAQGIMNNVDYIFALHVHPEYETGQIAIRSGKMNAAGDDFAITVQGKGGHASEPYKAIDPLIIGTEIVTALQTIVSRKMPTFDTPVLSVTMFHCGQAPNIIDDVAKIGGTIRSHDERVRVASREQLEKIVHNICLMHGATAIITWDLGCAAVINDEEATHFAKQAAEAVVGVEQTVPIQEPLFIAEDFSAYTEVVPGAMQLLGVYNKALGDPYPLHHSKFRLDEKALINGTQYFVQLAAELCPVDGNHEI
ncbi:M20 metallopeptidase family protein [Kurthia massiliensis]|uniref:M20 metallopeptidase family protein n=1 Tax=Kurthia massiliensis TaxID=1033739 RepID=UPI000287C7B2|nr:amidohydrolase [Kurthia massiliensis]